jgi:agmatinase
MTSSDQTRRGALHLVREFKDWGPTPWAAHNYPTYLGIPLVLTLDDLRACEPDVVVMGVPWDGTMGAPPGARLAPRAVRIAEYTGARGGSWHHPASRLNPLEHLDIVDFGDVPVVHGSVETSFERIRSVVRSVLGTGATAVLIGGDHAVTWPHVQALADVVGLGNVGVIHLDAHCDTWPLDPGEYTSHGAPMRQLISEGVVRGEHFVQVGLRSSTDPETLAFMRDHGMHSHWMDEIRQNGLEEVMDRAVAEALNGPEHLFLSVDIDVCDPAFAPATGAPEPGGLTSGELLTLVGRLAHEVGFAAMDLVELSPPFESGNHISAVLGHRVILEALTGLAARRARQEPAS